MMPASGASGWIVSGAASADAMAAPVIIWRYGSAVYQSQDAFPQVKAGRLAQGESASLTRKRSEVQIL